LTPWTFLFVTGARRSGTTALATSLNTHPEVGIFQEYGPHRLLDHVDAFFAHDTLDPAPADRTSGVPTAVEKAGWPLPRRSHDFEHLLFGIYASVFRGKSLRIIGDKTPTYINDVGFGRLLEAIPQTRLLYVLRNPVDVVHSSMKRAQLAGRGVDVWDVATVQDACREWIVECRKLDEVIASRRCPVLVVKYEELLDDGASAAWTRISEFLEVEKRFEPVLASPRAAAREATRAEAWTGFVETCFADVLESWRDESVDSILAKSRTIELPLLPGQVLLFGSGYGSNAYARGGFCDPEPDGCWTVGPKADIVCRVADLQGDVRLEIDFSSRVSLKYPVLELALRVNGQQRFFAISPTSWSELFRIETPLRPEGVDAHGRVHIEIEILQPKEADEAPVADSRAIGLFLRGIRLTRGSMVASTNVHSAASASTLRARWRLFPSRHAP
jgi:hypothetical protein